MIMLISELGFLRNLHKRKTILRSLGLFLFQIRLYFLYDQFSLPQNKILTAPLHDSNSTKNTDYHFILFISYIKFNRYNSHLPFTIFQCFLIWLYKLTIIFLFISISLHFSILHILREHEFWLNEKFQACMYKFRQFRILWWKYFYLIPLSFSLISTHHWIWI